MSRGLGLATATTSAAFFPHSFTFLDTLPHGAGVVSAAATAAPLTAGCVVRRLGAAWMRALRALHRSVPPHSRSGLVRIFRYAPRPRPRHCHHLGSFLSALRAAQPRRVCGEPAPDRRALYLLSAPVLESHGEHVRHDQRGYGHFMIDQHEPVACRHPRVRSLEVS